MAKRKKQTPKAPAADRSEIIKQCVIYVQQLAAYDAGFKVDHTDDSDHASKGGQIKKARRAMLRLIGLSPHQRAGAAPLTSLELHAKAGVLAAMYGLQRSECPDAIEKAYIRFFASEVSDFLAANHEVTS
jgi:hypothetical protein